MIEHITWPSSHFELRVGSEEAASPFLHSKHERPLKITFHTLSFIGLSELETEALEALLQLAHLPEIEALETAPGSFPYLEIGAFNSDDLYIPVTVRREDSIIMESGIRSPERWLGFAAALVDHADRQHPEVQSLFEDLVIAQAHCLLGRDILITSSPRLLAHRADECIRQANPRVPSEAAQIVGLFLRSRDNYTYHAGLHDRAAFDRGLFYLILARHRLPSMWRYFSACVHAEPIQGDDIIYLGQSILFRCVRALEARDAIGIQFYLPQNNNTRDAMMYHFDYLTLVLAGAFDAQARIARRAYRVDQPRERYASFRRSDFQEALRDSGANELYRIVSGQHFQDVMTLLYQLRNTIHGAGLPTVAFMSGTDPQASFVRLLPEHRDTLLEAAERCGSLGRWGLMRMSDEAFFEPFSYSTVLVHECFKLIDAIAAATEVTGLFPTGHAVPPLPDGPPEDNDTFSKAKRKRVSLLG